MSKDQEHLIWENLNEALYNARHHLEMGEKASYDQSLVIADKCIEALKILHPPIPNKEDNQ